jgi:dihydroorotate dehydrogenase
MGFPGQGAQVVAQRLKKKDQVNFILGVNLGKNKDTSLESAFEDYVQLIRVFAPLADYLAINISSPNTVGLRRLQNQKFLEILLTEIITARDQQAVKNAKRIPLLVKLSPDLAEEELIESLEVITSIGIDGVIATNTTISREGLKTSLAEEIGGLSGAPLTAQSTKVIRKISALTKGKLPIVAVGGIMTVENAKQKLDAGASIVQIYTGLIYNGPGFVKELLVGLA